MKYTVALDPSDDIDLRVNDGGNSTFADGACGGDVFGIF